VQRSDTNEVEVNVDLLNGRSFREAVALTNTILPDIVLASSNRRSIAKGSVASVGSGPMTGPADSSD
jgi:hypothetical protein